MVELDDARLCCFFGYPHASRRPDRFRKLEKLLGVHFMSFRLSGPFSFRIAMAFAWLPFFFVGVTVEFNTSSTFCLVSLLKSMYFCFFFLAPTVCLSSQSAWQSHRPPGMPAPWQTTSRQRLTKANLFSLQNSSARFVAIFTTHTLINRAQLINRKPAPGRILLEPGKQNNMELKSFNNLDELFHISACPVDAVQG